MAFSRTYVADYFRNQAEWRERKSEEHPDDVRNQASSIALFDLAGWVENLPGQDPRLERLASTTCFLDDTFNVGEEANRMTASYRFHRDSRTADQWFTEFVDVVVAETAKKFVDELPSQLDELQSRQLDKLQSRLDDARDKYVFANREMRDAMNAYEPFLVTEPLDSDAHVLPSEDLIVAAGRFEAAKRRLDDASNEYFGLLGSHSVALSLSTSQADFLTAAIQSSSYGQHHLTSIRS